MDAFIKLSVHTSVAVEKDLITGILSEAGFDGFEEEQHMLHAYISADLFDEATAKELLQPHGVLFSVELIPGKNWNDEWEKNFKPVLVNNFCCIRASFHPPVAGIKYDIVITPRMSFGTGHHATTYLMLQQMESITFKNKIVLDFGTGTGVLAILAEKLGAAEIVAIDNDKWSIENAGENVRENNCLKIRIEESGNIDSNRQFDVILANINRNVLLDQMANLSQHLKKDGVLLMSGLLSGDRSKIEAAAIDSGLRINEENELEGWIVLKLVHN
ncbi:50S ribosomal protein L11 methyltransferase [Flavitalea sp.]|nr:50S ribosomal protein L11 methyltransferase [Flavitalea sp.]